MSIWEYANPVKFLRLSDKVLPFFAGFSVIGLAVGLFWGFFFTPDDYRQGSTVKIIYLHVPSALMAINAWFMMLVASVIWLIRRHHVSALAAKAAAPIGITMTMVALITGALWGQPMWGYLVGLGSSADLFSNFVSVLSRIYCSLVSNR